jgi:hypothetical protein
MRKKEHQINIRLDDQELAAIEVLRKAAKEWPPPTMSALIRQMLLRDAAEHIANKRAGRSK